MLSNRIFRAPILAFVLLCGVATPVAAQAPARPAAPPADEVAGLLREEPMSVDNWPAWRGRLLAWLGDRSRNPDAAFAAARAFVQHQFDPAERRFPPALNDDSLAWYLLGSACLQDIKSKDDAPALARSAEEAFRTSLKLAPDFARAHRGLAAALLLLGSPLDAQQEFAAARRLDPGLSVAEMEAAVAAVQERWADAEQLFAQALSETPEDAGLARAAALCVVRNKDRQGQHAAAVKPLCDRFPDDGVLVCLHAVALAGDGDARAAADELRRARALGTDPEAVLSPEVVRAIERAAAPTWVELVALGFLGAAGLLAAVMLAMAGAGLLLAVRTRRLQRRGVPAHESALAKLYALALFLGLLLFYAAVPLVALGTVALTGLVLYCTFLLPYISVKLTFVILLIGLACAWAVLRSVFARPARGGFGVRKTAADCPALFAVLNEVARRVDTDPVDEVYLGPGAGVGVHQEGRGPFGLFGVRRRVLTLGLSALHVLTVDELRAILAHEYAHFSHRDTFVNRFISQVQLSLEDALIGMGQAGGRLNYINPFYWFLFLYYRSYSLLAAGWSRSREFLADRLAATLYGADVFAGALTRVSTDGRLFEAELWGGVGNQFEEDRAVDNLYQALRHGESEAGRRQQREELLHKALAESASVFAAHPSLAERLQAVAPLPPAGDRDAAPAVQLFDNGEAVEKELTEFLTGFVLHMSQLRAAQAQAAAQAEGAY
jgi:Zn-dependent protease with chaperone function